MSVRVCAGDQHQAVETLKSFEKKDSKVAVAAATNLSFLYNLVQFSSYSAVAFVFVELAWFPETLQLCNL